MNLSVLMCIKYLLMIDARFNKMNVISPSQIKILMLFLETSQMKISLIFILLCNIIDVLLFRISP